jgi:hypothetical protein
MERISLEEEWQNDMLEARLKLASSQYNWAVMTKRPNDQTIRPLQLDCKVEPIVSDI